MSCALFTAALMLLSRDATGQTWTKGPVIIGGDDSDDSLNQHYTGRGEYFFREAFNFFGRHVNNGKKVVVGIGINGGDAEFAFNDSFQKSEVDDLNRPGGPWTKKIVATTADIENFFTNCASRVIARGMPQRFRTRLSSMFHLAPTRTAASLRLSLMSS
jgi:hypothetical protein